MSDHYPNHGCKIVMDAPYGPSHCETCGRQWEPMTPQGSANHCAREHGSRIASLEADLARVRASVVNVESQRQALRTERDQLQRELAEARVNERRYPILRASVLSAPASAGVEFELLTTEGDIDAQCDQLAALAARDGGEK